MLATNDDDYERTIQSHIAPIALMGMSGTTQTSGSTLAQAKSSAEFVRQRPWQNGERAIPWKSKEASSFTKKAASPTAKRQWKEVANDALKRGASEGSAIRQANAVVANRGAKRGK